MSEHITLTPHWPGLARWYGRVFESVTKINVVAVKIMPAEEGIYVLADGCVWKQSDHPEAWQLRRDLRWADLKAYHHEIIANDLRETLLREEAE